MIRKHVVFLRISYWIGAILDAKAALIMLFPNLIPQVYVAIGGDPGAIDSVEAESFRMLASVMVFAWTCLLIWADRKPLERKGVLLLTMIPVLPGILATRLIATEMLSQIPLLYSIFSALLIIVEAFFTFSYILNTKKRINE